MANIKNQAGETKTGLVVLKEYFGMQPGQTISGFNEEVKKLSPESKEELVIGAAKELGYSVEV